MPHMNKLSNYATTIAADNGKTSVTYHRTAIVKPDGQTVPFDDGMTFNYR